MLADHVNNSLARSSNSPLTPTLRLIYTEDNPDRPVYDVGDHVIIYYHPENPRRFLIQEATAEYLSSGFGFSLAHRGYFYDLWLLANEKDFLARQLQLLNFLHQCHAKYVYVEEIFPSNSPADWQFFHPLNKYPKNGTAFLKTGTTFG